MEKKNKCKIFFANSAGIFSTPYHREKTGFHSVVRR